MLLLKKLRSHKQYGILVFTNIFMSQKKKSTKKKSTTSKKLATKKSTKKSAAKKSTKKPEKKKVSKKTIEKKKLGFSKKKLPEQKAKDEAVQQIDELGVELQEDIAVESVQKQAPVSEAPVESVSMDVDDAPVEIGPSNDDRIDTELTQIYENKDGSMPDMSHFDKKKKHRFLRALFTLIISFGLLGGVAYAGFFFFQPQLQFSQSDVIFSVRGDEEIMSGEEVRYRILYRNAQNVPLARASIQVRYPDGFVLEGTSVETSNEMQDTWELGTLEPGEGDSIDVWGRLYGSLGERQSLRAFLNYTPANFSSEFQKIEAFASEVKEKMVTIDLDIANEVAIGAETEMTITVTPRTQTTGPLVIALDPPVGFMNRSSEPLVDEDNTLQWSFEDITEPQTISLVGVFAEGERETLSVRALQWKDDSRQEDGFIVGETTKEIALVSTDVTANLVINGTLSDFAVQPGDTLSASIIVKNIGETTLNDVAATLSFDTPSIDNLSLLQWTELSDEADGTVVGEQLSDDTRRGSITWNRFQVSAFEALAPGDETVIDIAIPLKTIEDLELTQLTTSEIIAGVDLQFDKNGEREILSSNQLVLTVNSDTGLDVQHDIEDNKHTIRWIVTNAFHDLESLVLEADLFGDITWLEEELVVPAGEAVYDPEAKTLVWTIDQMPTSVDVLALQFVIETGEPNPSQTNLSSKIRFTAFDTVTEQTITIVGDEVLINVEVE